VRALLQFRIALEAQTLKVQQSGEVSRGHCVRPLAVVWFWRFGAFRLFLRCGGLRFGTRQPLRDERQSGVS
jgi:hypothetical protein